MLLPLWSSEIHVEIPSWFPWGRDYQPVTVNRFQDRTLNDIALMCFNLESELYFMSSPSGGYVGSMAREKYFRVTSDDSFHLGFLMVFAYSEMIEKALVASIALNKSAKGLSAGIASCSLWRGGVLEGRTKVIAVVSDDPFYDCTEYLDGLAVTLYEILKIIRPPNLSYYAEKFGYNRFPLEWEDINPYDVLLTQVLSEIESDSAKELIGGSPVINFPPFLGLAVVAAEN